MAAITWPCGCCGHQKKTADELEQRNRSKQIDKMIEKDKQYYKRQVKILLLGPGESGKSTFLKQMKIIHGHRFEEGDIREYRTVVYQNILKGSKVLVDARDKLDIPWEYPDSSPAYADHVMSLEKTIIIDSNLFLDHVKSCQKLWDDKGIKTAFERRREYQLGDSIKYFLDNLDRIGTENYEPTNLDILHARKATKGVTEFNTLINSIPFLFVDVGGQRSQRQKWFQCFDSVTSILFLVSSSEFDQVLLEDRLTNRMVESCNIFETIVNHRCFREVSIILFLNKSDLLKQKLERNDVDISKYFTEFRGDPHDLETVRQFLLKMFDKVRREKHTSLFHHFTTAVDTENIKVVFEAVRDSILASNLKQLMLQ